MERSRTIMEGIEDVPPTDGAKDDTTSVVTILGTLSICSTRSLLTTSHKCIVERWRGRCPFMFTTLCHGVDRVRVVHSGR